MLKFYYANTSISPIPTIAITQNNNYANDTIIGYTYTVTINGYVFPKTKNNSNNSIGIAEIMSGINFLQNIFTKNGSELKITKDNNNVLILRGGVLKDINFPETNNNWATYAEYSVTLEFTELMLFNENPNCSSGQIDNNSISQKLVDINKYKIEQFTDGWTFSLDEEASQFTKKFNIFNTVINVTYNISATGKIYFDSSGKVLPGWVQAKNFCQYRLYDQVKNLRLPLNGGHITLPITTDASCDATSTLASMYDGLNSLIDDIGDNYKVYNETVDCQLSESDGTFSLTYNAKLKQNNTTTYSTDDTIHTFNKQINYSKTGTKPVTTITINGTIQGLCEGGLVYSDGNFRLPDKGSLLVGSLYKSKYTSAKKLINKVFNSDEEDLSLDFKNLLEIQGDLADTIDPVFNCIPNASAKPSTFNLTKNYMEGTITYSAEYTTDRNCSLNDPNDDRTISKTTVDIEAPVPVIAEFAVPGGNYVLQSLNTKTARKITINSEGRYNKSCCKDGIVPLISSILANPSQLLPSNAGFPLPNSLTSILTNKSFTYNPVDGSYTMSLSYTCSKAC
jgi:hypothetical protein